MPPRLLVPGKRAWAGLAAARRSGSNLLTLLGGSKGLAGAGRRLEEGRRAVLLVRKVRGLLLHLRHALHAPCIRRQEVDGWRKAVGL